MSPTQPTLEHAFNLHVAGRLAEVARAYEHLPSLDAANARVHNLLGAQRPRHGDTADALTLLERATALEPGAAEYHANLGAVLLAAGRAAAAERACRCALAVRGDYPEPIYNLADFKIEPTVFDRWMRVLRRAPGAAARRRSGPWRDDRASTRERRSRSIEALGVFG